MRAVAGPAACVRGGRSGARQRRNARPVRRVYAVIGPAQCCSVPAGALWRSSRCCCARTRRARLLPTGGPDYAHRQVNAVEFSPPHCRRLAAVRLGEQRLAPWLGTLFSRVSQLAEREVDDAKSMQDFIDPAGAAGLVRTRLMRLLCLRGAFASALTWPGCARMRVRAGRCQRCGSPARRAYLAGVRRAAAGVPAAQRCGLAARDAARAALWWHADPVRRTGVLRCYAAAHAHAPQAQTERSPCFRASHSQDRFCEFHESVQTLKGSALETLRGLVAHLRTLGDAPAAAGAVHPALQPAPAPAPGSVRKRK